MDRHASALQLKLRLSLAAWYFILADALSWPWEQEAGTARSEDPSLNWLQRARAQLPHAELMSQAELEQMQKLIPWVHLRTLPEDSFLQVESCTTAECLTRSNARPSEEVFASSKLGGRRWVGPFWRSPAFLECEGFGFDPNWITFKNLLYEHIQRPGRLRLATPLVQIASRLVEKQLRVLSRLAGSAAEFEIGITGDKGIPSIHLMSQRHPVGALMHRQYTSGANVSDLGGFCQYGLVSALFVCAGVKIVNGMRNLLPESDLSFAYMLLGEGMAMDHIEATSWPIRSLDLEVNMHNQRMSRENVGTSFDRRADFLLYSPMQVDQAQASMGSTSEEAHPAARSFFYRRPASFPVLDPETDYRSLNHQAHYPATAEPRIVQVIILGGHGSAPLEPATAFHAAEVELAHPGARLAIHLLGADCGSSGDRANAHLCKLLCKTRGICDGGKHSRDPVSEVLKDFMYRAQARGVLPNLEEEMRLREAVQSGGDILTRAKFWVCTEAAPWCMLLQDALPKSARVMLYVPYCTLDTGLSGVQPGAEGRDRLLEWYGRLRAMLIRPDIAAATTSALNSAQMLWQIGASMPVVRPMCLYVRARWRHRDMLTHNIIVPRSRLLTTYGLPTGLIIVKLIEQLQILNDIPFNFEYLQYGNQVSHFVPFATMARYHAALVLPPVQQLMSFEEVYAMRIPVLLPSREWLARIWNNYPFGALERHAGYIRLSPAQGGVAQGEWEDRGLDSNVPPVGPKGDAESGWLLHLYWYGFTTFATSPHILRFDSVPEMFMLIAEADPKAVSAAMDVAARIWEADARAWWVERVSDMLKPQPAIASASVSDSAL